MRERAFFACDIGTKRSSLGARWPGVEFGDLPGGGFRRHVTTVGNGVEPHVKSLVGQQVHQGVEVFEGAVHPAGRAEPHDVRPTSGGGEVERVMKMVDGVLLVVDATTGQNGLEQARRFTETSGVTGIVLTKLDGTAKGGVVIAIARELGLPIRYVGVGEQVGSFFKERGIDLARFRIGETWLILVQPTRADSPVAAYLEQHGELPDDSLVAWVPINARRSSKADASSPGNRVTSMTAPIFTNVADGIERLRRIQAATKRSKAAKAGVSARLMTDLSQHVPAATQVLAGRLVLRAGMAARTCNLFISNIPGPQVPLYMNGALQVGAYGLAPLVNGMGLFIATPSYNGDITFNVTSTREIMPDVEFFIECIGETVEDLARCA